MANYHDGSEFAVITGFCYPIGVVGSVFVWFGWFFSLSSLSLRDNGDCPEILLIELVEEREQMWHTHKKNTLASRVWMIT
jgi:hypothetical protein